MRRDLWLIFVLKMLAITAYSVMNSTLVLYLSADLGYNDKQAGLIVASWSALLSLFTLMSGSFADTVGLRKAFLLGFTLCLWARAVMTFVAKSWMVLGLGLFPLAFGEALMTPVLVAAVKQYSGEAQRTVAFSMFYTMMNIGFAIAGLLFDDVRLKMGEQGFWELIPGVTLSTYRLLFFISWLITLFGLLLVSFAAQSRSMTEARLDSRSKQVVAAVSDETKGDRSVSLGGVIVGTWNRFLDICRTPGFSRFILLLTLMVGVRMVLYQMYYTFPKFALRELGEGAPIGRLFGVLNAMIVVIVTPFVGLWTQGVSTYRMLIIGSALAASAVFILALPPNWFNSLAGGLVGNYIGIYWLGLSGHAQPLHVAIILSVVLLSIGETIWSPRLYEYTAAIAPQGQAAGYMSLSMLPLFVAKFLVGGMSGWLLEAYCPVAGPRDSQMLWLYIGLMASITPVGLLVCRQLLSHPSVCCQR